MSHRCPVCKAPLWKEPFLLRRLKCPRCGAEFRPTVPLAYFRFLLLLFVLLSLTVVVYLAGNQLWPVFLFLLLLGLIFWFLPRLINLEKIPGDLTVVEGPAESGLQMKLDYPEWQEKEEKEELRLGPLYYACLGILLLLLGILALQLFRQ